MIQTLSDFYKIDKKKFNELGILDAFLEIDSHFFLDPLLLKQTSIPEFTGSRETVEKYFEDIIRLLKLAKTKYDLPWREAKRRLIFKEIRGVSIGHGSHSSDGSGIGPHLGEKLLERGDELVKLGVEDPAVFELIGLFVEDFGPDRLSDMTINIIRRDLYAFTERIAKELLIKNLYPLETADRTYMLPVHPKGRKYLIFLPKALLRDLPVAQSWEDIAHIASYNATLRARLNTLIGRVWQKANIKDKKEELKKLLMSDSESMKIFTEEYKKYPVKSYNFNEDPKGELIWYENAKSKADQNPINISLPIKPKIEDIEQVATSIIKQFGRNIQFNGLNELLYINEPFRKKKRIERVSQLLFYATADTYCEANNIDLNREPNAGSGHVDFKFSNGYFLRFIVEIKLSSNSNLVGGYTKQLRAYEESERTKHSAYVIIRIGSNENIIDEVLRLEKKAETDGIPHPKVFVVDGRLKPSASKR